MKVLLVDDEPDILEQAKIFLEKEKDELDIDTITSAGEALELLEDNNYDCIVSDYQMPELDGLSFLKILRKEKQDDIPFIMFTGKGREDVAMDALNFGADRYLQKGGGPRSQYGILAQAIVQEVEHHEARRKLRESEEKYRTITEKSHDAIFIYRDHEFLFVNEGACKLTGYSKDELYETNIWDLVHPEDIGRLREIDSKGREGEEIPAAYEARIVTKQGKTRHGDFRVTQIRYNGYYAVLGSVRDVTRRKESEEKLRQYRMAVEGSKDPMAACNEDYTYLFANKSYLDYYKLDHEKISDLTLKDVIGEKEFVDTVKPEVDKCLKGQTVEYEMIREFPGKGERRLFVSYYPLKSEEDGIEGAVAVLRDITESKDAQEKEGL